MTVQTSMHPFTGVWEPKFLLSGGQFIWKNFYSGIKVKPIKNLSFPGRGRPIHGEKSCGTFSRAYSCECKKSTKVVLHTCYKLTCPVCYQKGISRAAERVKYRFQRILSALRKEGVRMRVYHYSFNTLWQINDFQSFVRYKKKLLAILKKEGVHGVLLFHPWRVFSKKRMGFSPHWHVVGVGRPINSDLFYKKYEFTYTNITVKKGRKKENRKGVERIVKYLLSHVGIIDGKHSITWFNQFSYNRMRKRDEKKVHVIHECPTCKSRQFLIKNEIKFRAGTFTSELEFEVDFNFELDYDVWRETTMELFSVEYAGTPEVFRGKGLNS